jgi:hypothetical protein
MVRKVDTVGGVTDTESIEACVGRLRVHAGCKPALSRDLYSLSAES